MGKNGKPRCTVFKPEWLSNPKHSEFKLKEWLSQSKTGSQYAYCHVCSCDINLTNGGFNMVRQHSATKTHSNKLSSKESDGKVRSVTSFFAKGSDSSKSKSQKEIMEAEIRWTLHTVETSKSFNCEDSAVELFRVMFRDSKIAEGMSCSRTKQTYLLQFAILPYVESETAQCLLNKYFSISFDEADNRLAIMIRYLNACGKVNVDLLDLVPLKACNAASLTRTTIQSVEQKGLTLSNWISEETDNCNTMRGIYLYIKLHLNNIIGTIYR